METKTNPLTDGAGAPYPLADMTFGQIITAQPQQVGVQGDNRLELGGRSFRRVKFELTCVNIEHAQFYKIIEKAQRHAVEPLDVVWIAQQLCRDVGSKLGILA